MNESALPPNFIRTIVTEDVKAHKHNGQVTTRFPPEPNGYLHIGHAKSIVLNFGIAAEFGGRCNLRYDDTNPEKENPEFIAAIERDVRWLGYQWTELRHASDYFAALYDYAVALIRQDKAYVDSLSAEDIRARRGTLTEPGTESPYRNRPMAENLDLFERMRRGEFAEGAHVLRAKVDMASPNLNLRDPVLYRIRRAPHPRTGHAWRIYPMYDFAHCLSDAIEGITHSLCTLEFEDHRPLYDWILDELRTPCHPQQIEFARLNLSYTLMSKRKLQQLVEQGHVAGWDDPRLPTIAGIRRRGYPPAAIRNFCERIGITKKDSLIDMGLLENSVREDLDRTAPRALAVLNPLRLVIENYPENQVEMMEAVNHPNNPAQGTRQVPFCRVLYIEREDFMEAPPKQFFRLAPGKEVRLRFAYYVTCTGVAKNEAGEVIEVRCTYDPETRGGGSPDGRKVKGTLHWVSAVHALKAEVRLYDRLFITPNPAASEDFTGDLNPQSRITLTDCKIESSLAKVRPGDTYQFERQGYFCADIKDSTPERLVFNRTVTLRDSWAKIEKALA